MSFTNRRHLHTPPPTLSCLFTSLHKSCRLAYSAARSTFFHRRKNSPRSPGSSQFIHPGFIHVQFGNEPVSISIGNREQRGCVGRSIRRSRVTDQLVNNTAMVADRNAALYRARYPWVGLVGWQDRVFSSLGGVGKLAPRGNCSVITSSNNFLRDITHCCLQASALAYRIGVRTFFFDL